ncbi:radical SAM family heme chaperone HemW [Candidatus Profftella armatura]|uniref:radical SAM family heme chaperone HemW n=1 Tax=Candidatus Profftella armatura TaxID=669502 RepID=UPI003D969B18
MFQKKKYLEALLIDVELSLPIILNRKIHTIFIGGGTPSLISDTGLDYLLKNIKKLLLFKKNISITLEANPSTFEIEKFHSYSIIGINRLSIGIQSFNNKYLNILGRTHDSKQAKYAIEIAKQYFNNFNLDLIYALPNQTLSELMLDLNYAIQYSPPHLSLYSLTIEPNTYFFKYPPLSMPSNDENAVMQDKITSLLKNNYYKNYEISAYSKTGYESQHNLNYWKFGDYLGIGAGSHSKLSFPNYIIRQIRYKNPNIYLKNIFSGNSIAKSKKIEKKCLIFEFMLNALRLKDGFSPNLFFERTGINIKIIESKLKNAEKLGLLKRNNKNIKPTSFGRYFLNDLQQIFLNN